MTVNPMLQHGGTRVAIPYSTTKRVLRHAFPSPHWPTAPMPNSEQGWVEARICPGYPACKVNVEADRDGGIQSCCGTRKWSAVVWCGQAKGKEMWEADQSIGEGLDVAVRHAKAMTKVCDKQAK